jgi:subtilisin family serine protease
MKRTALILLPLLCLSIATLFWQGTRAHAQVGPAEVTPLSGEREETPPEQFASTDDPIAGQAFVPGELLVKFSRGAQRDGSAGSVNAQLGAVVLRQSTRTGWQHLRLPAGVSTSAALSIYASAPGVLAVQPNYIYREAATPDDPSFPAQYGMQKIQAPAAWDTTTGSSAVVVAVLDTGIFYPHEDLSQNMWRNPGETGMDANGNDKATNGVDDDADGYVDDVYGIDTYNHDSNPIDDRGHGTHCAGIIGAAGNNAKGVAGVNWSVQLMALKFISQQGEGTSAGAIECLDYVMMMKERGVNVLITSNSYGDTENDPAFKDAFDAAGAAGLLNVCAAGNGATNTDNIPFYPASYDSPSIISVAASDASDNAAGFTNYGVTTVDLAAPGVGILSTVSDGPMYDYLSGTSMSAPHVAGAAALLLAQHPSLDAASLKSAVLNSADALPQWSGKVRTGGRLNVARALRSLDSQANIGGVVRDENGGKLENVTVRLLDRTGALLQSVQTGEKGSYQFSNLPQGYDYVVDAALSNYSFSPQSQSVSDLSADLSLDFTATPQSCNFSLSSAGQHFGPSAGSGFFNVTVSQGCDWKVRISDDWVGSFRSDGDGNGTVPFYVEVNTTHTARSATIDVGGQIFSITQDAASAACQYSVTPSQTVFGPQGGSGSVQVSVAGGCEWRARSNDFWIVITSGSGSSGSGVVTFNVGGNGGPMKSGTMTIAGQTVTIQQEGATGVQPAPGGVMQGETGSVERAQQFLLQSYESIFGALAAQSARTNS